MKQKENKMSF